MGISCDLSEFALTVQVKWSTCPQPSSWNRSTGSTEESLLIHSRRGGQAIPSPGIKATFIEIYREPCCNRSQLRHMAVEFRMLLDCFGFSPEVKAYDHCPALHFSPWIYEWIKLLFFCHACMQLCLAYKLDAERIRQKSWSVLTSSPWLTWLFAPSSSFFSFSMHSLAVALDSVPVLKVRN